MDAKENTLESTPENTSPRKKSDVAIALIRKVVLAAEAAHEAAREYIRDTERPTADEAHQRIDDILSDYECESPQGHIVAPGLQAVEPHEHGHGVIQEGVSVVIDIFPQSKESGYFADMSRTLTKGTPSAELQKLYDTVLAAQELAIGMLEPGRPYAALHNAVVEYFTKEGYETRGKGKEFSYEEGFVHALGHGVGKKVHEVPIISPRSEEVIEVGDVITLEPGLYYKHLGAVRIEDMFLITKDGPEALTRFPKEFVV